MRFAALGVVAIGLLWPSGLLALPEDPGTLQVQELSKLETVGGKTLYFDLYIPNASKPCPIIALGHGFMRSRVMMRDWGKLLASRGYVAAAPDFPAPGSDHATDGKLLSALLDWMVKESGSTGSPLAGRVDATRRGVVGHSAGGLASILAAAGDPQIDVVVGLDPVDVSSLGTGAAPTVKVPVAVLRAAPGQCNENGNASAIYAALAGPALTLQVSSATHCDPEWPSDPMCSLLCGAADTTRRSRFVRYAMATLDYVLRCDASMAPWLGGASSAADTLVQGVTTKSFPPSQLGCSTANDASPGKEGATKDLGVRDARAGETSSGRDAGRDAGPSRDTGVDSKPGADLGSQTPASDDGCSCAIAVADRGAPAGLALLCILLFLIVRCTPRGRR